MGPGAIVGSEFICGDAGFPCSRFGLKLISALILLAAGLGLTLNHQRGDAFQAQSEAFVCDTVTAWRSEFGDSADLQVIRQDVSFNGGSRQFATGEGVVALPIGLNLDGAQEVLASASLPPALKSIDFEGIVNQFWEYPAAVHKDLDYISLTLVRRSTRHRVALPETSNHRRLPDVSRVDATLDASELEEHDLHQCKEFDGWPERATSPGGPLQRLLELANEVGFGLVEPGQRWPEDVCAAIRQNLYSPHQAQVALVMAARAMGLPAYGVTAADPESSYLVAVWEDSLGWISLDVKRPEQGWFSGGPGLLTKAPLIVEFDTSNHGFWYAGAQAHSPDSSYFSSYLAIAHTDWQQYRGDTEQRAGLTRARSFPLSEMCGP